MKKFLLILLILFSFNALYSQDVIYTINGKIDNQNTSLDSILVENLTNNTRLLFKNLPDLPDYNINLTKQAFWGATGIHNLKESSAFSTYINTPGLLSLACNINDFSSLNIFVYNMQGQRVYAASNVRLNRNSLINFHFGSPGLYLVEIKSDLGIQTFKGAGLRKEGASVVTMDIRNAAPLPYGFKDTKQTSTSDFSFKLGDSLRFSVYKNQYYASPITIKVSGSGTISFVLKHDTLLTGTFTDSRDGQTYKTVKIGNQEWMAENLKYLPSVSSPSQGSEDSAYYYVYDYQGTNVSEAKATTNYKTYGVLYNWTAAKNACPSGWHLSSDDEWKILEMYLGMSQKDADDWNFRGTDEGIKLRSTSGWKYDGNGTDVAGFSALPGGKRYGSGSFGALGQGGGWWSATTNGSGYVWYRYLASGFSGVFRNFSNKTPGFSVRCVRDSDHAPVANFTASTTRGKAPLTVTFTDHSSNTPVFWHWDFGDGHTSILQNPSHTYTQAGTYRVTLTATNSYGSGTIKTDSIVVGYAPVASFTVSQTSGDAPLTVTFTDQSTHTPTSWHWDFGDGDTSTLQNPTHTYTQVGVYHVALTATNSYGSNTYLEADSIIVGDVPVANFTASPTSGDAPLTVTFTDQSIHTPTSWYWDFGDGDTSTLQNPTHTYTQVGNYTVTLTATNKYATNTKAEKCITVYSIGTFTDSRDGQTYKTVKIGNQEWMAENLKYLPSVSPSSQVSEDSAYYYVYGYQGTNVSEAKDTTNYKTYGVLYNWTAAQNACPSGWHLPSDDEWKILEMYLGMSQKDADNWNFRGTDEGKKLKSTSGWQNDGNGTDAVGFSALPGGDCFGGGYFGDLGNGGYWWSATVGGSGYVWYRYLDAGKSGIDRDLHGKTAGYSVRCVRDSDHAPVANFTASTTTGKAPLTVTFTDHSSNTPVFWHWDFGDGGKSTLQNPTHTYTQAGTYRVTLTAINSYGSGTIKTDSIVVVDAPVANFTASPAGSTAPVTVTFTDHSSNTPTSWHWDFGDGDTSTLQNPTHTYTQVGAYMVTLTATNKYGTNTKTEKYTVYSTGTFTDSRDGQTYKTVKIGNQEWMAENLKYLPSVSPSSQGSEDSAYYYVYGYQGDSVLEAKDSTNYKTYGVLYNWTAAQNACPSGWHLPSDDEWKTLEMYLGMSQSDVSNWNFRGTDEGKKLKSTSGWEYDGNGTNAVGFSALPGGNRNKGGYFGDLGNGGYWWSATASDSLRAWRRYLDGAYGGVARYFYDKANGYSVRCVRDQ